jgi:hypothetical protein
VNHSGRGIDPETGEIRDFVLDARDGLDAIFKAHDEAYKIAEEQSDWGKAEEMYHAADKALVDAIGKYDSSKDPLLTDQAAQDAAAAFAWKAGNLFQGIINQREKMYPGIGTKPFDDILEDIMTQAGIGIDLSDIVNLAANLYTSAKQFIFRYDPLTLDMDGDGIETISVNSSYPVYFDFNGNEIKTNTGWVSPDDGFLVFDRNGNGAIDNASELFSDYTPLYVGGQAADGFAALLQEDTNNDGIVNNLDANWNNLKIWQDINSDGISQSEELFTMEEAGISGLNVAKSNINQNFPNGNSIKGTGPYIKSDGTTGLMGNVYFAVDTSKQQFPDTPILPEVEGLPNIWGSGLMRDLHQAASLSPQLQNLLIQYSEAATRQEMLRVCIHMWKGTKQEKRANY